MKYIDAERITAKINQIIEGLKRNCNPDPMGTAEECLEAAEIEALELVKSAIDEMKQEEPTKTKFLNLCDHYFHKKYLVDWCDYGVSHLYIECVLRLDILDRFSDVAILSHVSPCYSGSYVLCIDFLPKECK